MTLIVSTTKMTAEQYLQLGEDPPGVRLELVEGEVAVSPSPASRHSFTINKLAQLIMNHIDLEALGGEFYTDVDTILNEFNVRRPDILYFSEGRTHLVGENAMQGPPDLAVEVVSPSSVEIDRRDKFLQYAAAGIAFYWIVDPQHKTLEAWRLEGRQYLPVGKGQNFETVQFPPFPNLSIELRRIWQPRN
jgi:Uma2 family endonuclease